MTEQVAKVSHGQNKLSELQLNIGPLINVSSDKPSTPHVEPVIAVNPKKNSHMVVAAIQFNNTSNIWEDGAMTVEVMTSFNAGKSWQRIELTEFDQVKAMADPWLVWSPANDTLYLSCLVQDYVERGTTTWLFKSVDGIIWSKPSKYVFGKDKEQDHTILMIPSSGNPNLLGMIATATDTVLGVIEIVRSEDFGNTFKSLKRYAPDSENNNISSSVMLGEDQYVFCYHDMTQPDFSLWAVTTNGKNFSRCLIDSAMLPMGFQTMSFDNSPRFNRRVYLGWIDIDKRNDENLNVNISYSDDKGSNWSKPVILNSNSTPSYKAVPVISVNNKGVILAAWADFRHCSTSGCYDVYVTASTDGGNHFIKERRVTTASSKIFTKGNGAAGNRYRIAGGDYWSIASDSNGDFYLTWGDSSSEVYQIMMTKIEVIED